MKDIVGEWDDLGEVLGLSHAEVAAIKTNYPQDVKGCLKEVINSWLEQKGVESPSCKSLMEALRHPLINRKDVASEIDKYVHLQN